MSKTVLFLTISLVLVPVFTHAVDVGSLSSNWSQNGFLFEILMAKMQSLQQNIFEEKEQSKENTCNLLTIVTNLAKPNKTAVYTDCKYAPSNASGLHMIQPEKPFKEPMTVLCDQEYDSGGWIVIQHRFNGSTNFYRNWKEYKNGFGQLEGEFWLGLDRIHQLTTSKPHELAILLEDFDGNKTYAKYNHFEIGGESELYTLKTITGYSGTAGESLIGVAGMKFSTLDSDNDTWQGSCAVTYTGAWWYSACHKSNLNGRYLRGETKEYATGMVWYTFRGHHYSLRSSKMMIRPVVLRK